MTIANTIVIARKTFCTRCQQTYYRVHQKTFCRAIKRKRLKRQQNHRESVANRREQTSIDNLGNVNEENVISTACVVHDDWPSRRVGDEKLTAKSHVETLIRTFGKETRNHYYARQYKLVRAHTTCVRTTRKTARVHWYLHFPKSATMGVWTLHLNPCTNAINDLLPRIRKSFSSIRLYL